MAQWVDFKELRSRLDMRRLLDHYGVEVKLKGDQAHGFCPLPTHEGKRRSRSFSANVTRGIWQCFGCGAKGNALDFAARMEGFDPGDRRQLREAALRIKEKFLGEANQDEPSEKPEPPSPQSTADDGETAEAESEPNVVVNAPIDFELKGLDPEHPYLKERGLTRETIEHFGLGYCSRGLMKGRIVIPIHNPDGQLVGYAGRLVDDSAIDADNPKYLLPPKRKRGGMTYEFRKSEILFNAHRLDAPVDELIVVEGFFDVFWLWQNGYPNTVALMGAECSERQLQLIAAVTEAAGRVWLMPDGDKAGERCARESVIPISLRRFVRWVALEPDFQPTELKRDPLATYLGGK